MQGWMLIEDAWYRKSAVQGVKVDGNTVFLMIQGDWHDTGMNYLFFDAVKYALGIDEEGDDADW